MAHLQIPICKNCTPTECNLHKYDAVEFYYALTLCSNVGDTGTKVTDSLGADLKAILHLSQKHLASNSLSIYQDDEHLRQMLQIELKTSTHCAGFPQIKGV